MITKQNWVKEYDSIGKVPYAHDGEKQWVGYEDPDSLQIKMEFIMSKGYGGTMTWAIDFDDFHGTCGPQNPLITVMYRNMKNYRVPCQSYPSKPKTSQEPWNNFPPSLPPSECPEEVHISSTQKPFTQRPISFTTQRTFAKGPNMKHPSCQGRDLIAHEKCNKYYWCIHGSALEYSCPEGKQFDSSKNLCRDFIPHEKCNKYYWCLNGSALEYTCPEGKHFDSVKGLCIDPRLMSVRQCSP